MPRLDLVPPTRGGKSLVLCQGEEWGMGNGEWGIGNGELGWLHQPPRAVVGFSWGNRWLAPSG
jgi:hypothetical protein